MIPIKDPVVLFVSPKSDYANVGAIFAKCLQTVGVNADAITKAPTVYNPPYHARVYRGNGDVIRAVQRADIVIWMHSLRLDFVSGKRNVAFHGGTRYRLKPNKRNRIFTDVYVSLIQTADILGLGAKNEFWMLPAAYIGDTKPDFSVGDKIVVGHFPSARTVDKELKGSSIINEVMKRYKDKVEYRFSMKVVDWIDSIQRMNECDIYIESLNSASESPNKHDWSMAALEAAALGDVVVTNFKYGEQRYKKEYGDCALQVANTKKELIDTLDRLVSLDKESLINLKHQSNKWATTIHGLEATGNRLKKALEIEI